MNLTRNTKIAYWASTLFFIVPAGLMGFVEAATGGPPNVAAMVLHLGYPAYLVHILGTAKALGMLAIVTGFSPKLKEWAYAGFVINLLGATASHVFVGDGAGETLLPLSMLLPTLISYRLWHKGGGYGQVKTPLFRPANGSEGDRHDAPLVLSSRSTDLT
jgi:hypothetical protein